MKKIVLLPLDERPCNFNFPYEIFNGKKFNIVRPKKLGAKKTPADFDEIKSFLFEECKDADGLVLSVDTLLYGGLIPSRLHHFSEEEIEKRLDLIRELKRENPTLIVFGFQCIMRCPKYSSSDEEPDYYEICGEEIHKIGAILHKKQLGISDENDLENLYKIAKPEFLNDYTERRKFNLNFNLKTLSLVKEKVIDFLVIPQDDSAKYGFTALDQIAVREKISAELLQTDVLIYPGADEVAMTLLAKFANFFGKRMPKVFVKYAAEKASILIPSYEDRSLAETLKYQLLAAGCMQISSQNEADFILAISAPAAEMTEAIFQPSTEQGYCVERNITEFSLYIEECVRENIPVTIGDNAYANGADLELVAILNKLNLLDKVAGFAGWNTSSNTIGTAIAQGVCYLYCKNSKEHFDFLASRYIEDAGYCSVVRKKVSTALEPLGMNYFDVKETDGKVAEIVKNELKIFIEENLSSIAENTVLDRVYMPWKRMFEVGISASYTAKI